MNHTPEPTSRIDLVSRFASLLDGDDAEPLRTELRQPVHPLQSQVVALAGEDVVRQNVPDTSEPRLSDCDEHFQQLVDEMRQTVWVCDSDGRSIYRSRVCYEYIGEAPGSSLGQDRLRFYHPDDRDALMAAWMRSVRSDGVMRITPGRAFGGAMACTVGFNFSAHPRGTAWGVR